MLVILAKRQQTYFYKTALAAINGLNDAFSMIIIEIIRKMRVKRKEKSIIIQEDAPEAQTPPRKPHLTDLKNIIEVTEENDPAPLPILPSPKEQEAVIIAPPPTNYLRKFTRCISSLWRSVYGSPNSYEIDLNSEDLTTIILKLRGKKPSAPPLLPPQTEQRRILVLDLDQTLIHTSFTRPKKFDFESDVTFNGKSTRIYTTKRFGLDAFLFEMSQLYEVVVFTASQREYANRVIDLIDPKRRIAHRLYREHCVAINKQYFLKNIQALGRKAADIILVDDNAIAGLLQPDNFYKIDPFDGNQKDRQLYRLSAFLKHIHSKNKVCAIKTQRKLFEQLEIDLSEDGDVKEPKEVRSLAQRKRQYQHKKTTSQVQELATKSTEDENEAETTASDMVKSL